MTPAQERAVLAIALKGSYGYRRQDLVALFDLIYAKHYSVVSGLILLNEAVTFATRAKNAIKILNGEPTQ